MSDRADDTGAPDVRVSMWRAAVGFRVAALAYLVVVHARLHERFARPGVGIAVLGVAGLVTVALAVLLLAGLPTWRRGVQAAVVAGDVVVTATLTLATLLVQAPADYGPGRIPTVTTVWAAGPLLEAAVVGGVLWGVLAAVAQFTASVLAHGVRGNDSVGDGTLANGAVLLLAATATGYAAAIATRGQQRLLAASAAEARVAERERLARDIHDGALQTLALLHRRLADADVAVDLTERARLAELAADQERAMRSLLAGMPVPVVADAGRDLVDTLRRHAGAAVTVNGPGTPVVLAGDVVDGLSRAVGAALDNVARHAGPAARAWVLVDAEAGGVTVSVRDDGVGTTPGRLAAAAAEGRLGVAGSVRGRVEALGGHVHVRTAPGQGVEVTLRVPTPEGARGGRRA